MSLTVYGAPLSPFVRKVRLCLAEKDLEYQLEIVLPFGQPAWYRQLSPLGRIPALKDGDFSLADSSVICQYLEDNYPDCTHLQGQNAEQRARVRWLEKYSDYELAPQCTFSVFRNRALKPSMGQPCDEAAVQTTLTEKLPAHFDYLEQSLGTAEYFVGDSLSLADLAFACQIINMEHGDEQLDAQRWPSLAALHQRVKARPSVQALLPGEQKMLAKMAAKA
ncbi:glutathione S-transferase family protein [Pseudomonas sp. CC6-YY-74]|uniref:glutathione S-transferase family protein n=1 Tax=Pseudomonas sp. CC6-YY-74 TaxID=1930532 RepID=UPI0009A23FF2|nr:glutathione S-transferase family protein [Pseudomonas sp. CC6-YY-74]